MAPMNPEATILSGLLGYSHPINPELAKKSPPSPQKLLYSPEAILPPRNPGTSASFPAIEYAIYIAKNGYMNAITTLPICVTKYIN